MTQYDRPIYMDCAATTPIDPRVRDVVLHYTEVEFGNAGSRTHIYGREAVKGVNRARNHIASAVDARPEEVIFTSGATEANNLAILGLAEYGKKVGKMHVLSTQIEHKAVLQPLAQLKAQGFEVELIPPLEAGYIDPAEVAKRIRDDTLLVSVMHANNETGVIQPLSEICEVLNSHPAVFHVDAAQGFCKDLKTLQLMRLDLITASGHKLYAPKGIGCLIIRRNRNIHRFIKPLQFGGEQERGIRPGTLPVALVCGFGHSALLSVNENASRIEDWKKQENLLLESLKPFSPKYFGKESPRLANTLNFSLGSLDSEVIILALKDVLAISNGSACNTDQITPSYVIEAMTKSAELAHQACRASWCHMTPHIRPDLVHNALSSVIDDPQNPPNPRRNSVL